MSAEALKAKWKPVVDFLSTRGALIHHLHEEGGKLVLEASVHDDAEKNRVWDQIKDDLPKGADGKITHPISAAALKPVVASFEAQGKPFNMGMVFPVRALLYSRTPAGGQSGGVSRR